MSIGNRLRASASPLVISLAALSLLLATGGPVAAEDTAAKAAPAQNSNEELLKKLELMEKRIQTLEGQLKQKQASAPAAGAPTPAATPAAGDPSAPGATKPAAPANPVIAKKPELTEEQLFAQNVKDIFFSYDNADVRADEQECARQGHRGSAGIVEAGGGRGR